MLYEVITIRQNEKPSMSSFKHLVYGLRTLFSMFKNEKIYLALPPVQGSKALPVVFLQTDMHLLKAIVHLFD